MDLEARRRGARWGAAPARAAVRGRPRGGPDARGEPRARHHTDGAAGARRAPAHGPAPVLRRGGGRHAAARGRRRRGLDPRAREPDRGALPRARGGAAGGDPRRSRGIGRGAAPRGGRGRTRSDVEVPARARVARIATARSGPPPRAEEGERGRGHPGCLHRFRLAPARRRSDRPARRGHRRRTPDACREPEAPLAPADVRLVHRPRVERVAPGGARVARPDPRREPRRRRVAREAASAHLAGPRGGERRPAPPGPRGGARCRARGGARGARQRPLSAAARAARRRRPRTRLHARRRRTGGRAAHAGAGAMGVAAQAREVFFEAADGRAAAPGPDPREAHAVRGRGTRPRRAQGRPAVRRPPPPTSKRSSASSTTRS